MPWNSVFTLAWRVWNSYICTYTFYLDKKLKFSFRSCEKQTFAIIYLGNLFPSDLVEASSRNYIHMYICMYLISRTKYIMQSYFNLVPIYFSEMNLVTYVATYLVFERRWITGRVGTYVNVIKTFTHILEINFGINLLAI